MRKLVGSLIALLLVVLPVRAEQSQDRVVEESWEIVQLEGAQVGNSHTVVREVERDGKKSFITTAELKLNIKREGKVFPIGMESGSEETADGKVTRVWMRQFQGGHTLLLMQGIVKGDELELTVKGQSESRRTIPWDDKVIGLYKQEKLFQEHKAKPGDKFSFLSFEPTVGGVLTNRVTVKDYEEVRLLKGKKERLLRIEEIPDKVEGPQGPVQLPGLTAWLDKDLRPVVSSFEMPLLGKMTLYHADKLTASGQSGATKDIIVGSLIRLDRTIPRPNQTRSAVYRVTIKGDDDPGTAFAQDERQKSSNMHGSSFDLKVKASHGPRPVENPGQPKPEYLKSCFWIDSDDALVKRLASAAVGNETDPWTRAQLVERWVHQNMEVSFTRDFCPAGEVARQRSGDCRQHSMLATAMCRAVGIPSRTAIGLVYAVDRIKGPVMAFHMWTEVWIDGQWLSIDATRGEGHVGATHLKVTDSSWFNETSMRPLLPVIRVVGKLSIKVVSVDQED
ncbi:MAG TPA: transglutaminase-like domain-containing protein [Gemmataceae bacterium]|nr:transglutaminase-like domain-containing protein [Gemmataceae bacterium]